VPGFRRSKIGIKELSMKFVEKVFINEKLMFTITKWLKLSGDVKIVNLNPFYFQLNLKQKADG